MTTPPGLPAMPKALGRYEIQSEIGRGSMGVVYKAEDPVLGRSVALKVIHVAFPVGEDEQRGLEQRFLLEASLAASLSHPNIVVVHDVGRDPQSGTPFIALEYLEGRTLADVMATGQSMDWRVAAGMVARLAEALHHAHSNGVVHRDIKPSNIMLLPSGQAKILDFGVAKASNAHVTSPGELWGTPFYMSPEQASGQRVDGRSDLFSLGSVLYELVTGRRAFGREGVAQVIHGLLHEDPPRPSRINAALPPAMDAVVARALAKDLDKRYPDGRTFVEDIDDVLQGRPLRERGLAQPSTARAGVESGPYTPLHHSPPTLTHRFPSHPRWQRYSRRAARTLNLTLGAALGIGAVAMVMGATAGTVETSSAVSAVPTAAPIAAPMAAPPMVLVSLPAPLLQPSEPARSYIVPAPSAVPLETARVAIALEHGLKEGRVKIWVDEKVVLDEPLAAETEGRSVLLFKKKRRGRFTDVLDVAPGEHTVRLEVDGDGEKRGAILRGLLRRDQTRLLVVKVGGNISVEWKS
jgi:serine/threonine-protein kinase